MTLLMKIVYLSKTYTFVCIRCSCTDNVMREFSLCNKFLFLNCKHSVYTLQKLVTFEINWVLQVLVRNWVVRNVISNSSQWGTYFCEIVKSCLSKQKKNFTIIIDNFNNFFWLTEYRYHNVYGFHHWPKYNNGIYFKSNSPSIWMCYYDTQNY